MQKSAPKLSAADIFGLGPTFTIMFVAIQEIKEMAVDFPRIFPFFFSLIRSPKIIALLEKQQPSPSRGSLAALCFLAKTMKLEFD